MQKIEYIRYKNENILYDYVMCIAVIHHLSNKERRKQAIKELLRITKKDGKILIYVWAKRKIYKK